MSDDSAAKRSFTSWKLDIQNCILRDRRLSPGAKVQAIFVLGHVNETTGIARVGQETICDELNYAVRKTAYRHQQELVRAKWFSVKRIGLKKTNEWTPLDTNVNGHLDLMIARREARETAYRKREAQKTQVTGHRCPVRDDDEVAEWPIRRGRRRAI